MRADPDREARLEQLVSRALAEQPERRAPAGLASRVFEQIARRASLPWWRQGFAHWPLLARLLFLGGCGALGSLAFLALARQPLLFLTREPGQLGAPAFSRLAAQAEVLATLAQAAEHALRAIPDEWLYGGLALAAIAYVAVFAAAAAAYRFCTGINPEVPWP